MKMSGNAKDLTGCTFGKLTAIKPIGRRTGRNKHSLIVWECKCECGNSHTATSSDLLSGNTKSCGCGKNKPKHGKAGTRIYHIYQCMIQRCYNQKHINYGSYGGRGIKVCDEWLNNFVSFLKWADGNGYAENKELDRIDVNGDYSPNNCRWISHLEQCQNRRTNVYISINGVKHTLAEWARISGITYNTIYFRYSHGITGAALIAPPKRKKGVQHEKQ